MCSSAIFPSNDLYENLRLVMTWVCVRGAPLWRLSYEELSRLRSCSSRPLAFAVAQHVVVLSFHSQATASRSSLSMSALCLAFACSTFCFFSSLLLSFSFAGSTCSGVVLPLSENGKWEEKWSCPVYWDYRGLILQCIQSKWKKKPQCSKDHGFDDEGNAIIHSTLIQ